ncbi:MAG: zinc carboxypeptidase [Bacteroidetes bacterium]|nr:zinc carboxypeptidase [Bacteroidota bacterium]
MISSVQAQDVNYYLPEGTEYNRDITSPDSHFGYHLGKWHLNHQQIYDYLSLISKQSDRLILTKYAKTEEDKKLIYLTISSPANLSRIEDIRKEHIRLSDPAISSSLDIATMPVVIYQGYSVHGDEPSGANSSVMYAYYLAAAMDKKLDSILTNTIILLDPMLNPDGLDRFAQWTNMHKSSNPVGEPMSREHRQVWPGGRTNHYWFDLNRDWLPAQHNESRGRLKTFHKWKPNVLTDHHEMWTNSTFFFQPGIESRTYPLTPGMNYKLTERLGKYQAKAFDKTGSLYYSKESFDDFYYGKGSTYPDINGAIGILYEQASSRGQAQKSSHGLLTFPFTISNQITASLSTLEGAYALRKDLLNYQREFYQDAAERSKKDGTQAFVFESKDDAGKFYHLIELLTIHDIKIYRLAKDLKHNGKTYSAKSGYVLPLQQQQYLLIKAMFDIRSSFTDSIFYDVSSWTMPLAFNLNYTTLGSRSYSRELLGEEINLPIFPTGSVVGDASLYAYVFEWNEYYAPRALNKLLQKGMIVKVASKPFSIVTNGIKQNFGYGSILVPVSIQKRSADDIHKLMEVLAVSNSLSIYSISSGLTGGVNLGSPSFKKIKKPKVLLLVGDGVRAYDAGEIWHLLDKRMEMELVLLDIKHFSRISLKNYTTILMVNGGYDKLKIEKLTDWVKGGGNIVAIGSAITFLKKSGLAKVDLKRAKNDTTIKERRPYIMMDADRGSKRTSGAIVSATMDLTHPLCYGYREASISLFKRGNRFMELPKSKYASPIVYNTKVLRAGYMTKENQERVQGTAAAVISGFGSGHVICLVDDPNFRGFWYGTNKLMLNGIFFGSTIRGDSTEKASGKKK